MPVVLITRPLPEEGIRQLVETHETDIIDRQTISEDELIEAARGAQALLTLLSDPITERVLESLPDLKIVAQYAVGYDNIDVAAARRLGITVTNTPDVLTDATADLAFALLLAAARQIVQADRYVREGQFKRWETTLMLGAELRGKTIGILGMGRIGRAMARRALGFGMDVIYHNRTRANPTHERLLDARYVSIDELLRESDFLSLHSPLNADSRGLINADALSKMKPSAILINTARGPIVDEAALARALRDRRIAAAGLDVFQREPEVEAELLDLDNVVLAPHLGSATVETRTRMAEMCSEAILAALKGEEVPYRIA